MIKWVIILFISIFILLTDVFAIIQSGDMHTSIYDTNKDSIVDNADLLDTFHYDSFLKEDENNWVTFVPTVTLVGGAGNTIPEYTTNSGRYAQCDEIVFVNVSLIGDGGNEGAGTGIINIALPVTAGANKIDGNLEFTAGTCANGSGPEILTGSISQLADTIALQRQSAIRNIPNFKGENQSDTTRKIRLHFWYEVD